LKDKTFEELENTRKDKGSLSTSDYDDVFQKVIRKELKVREYYGDEYWSNMPDSHVHSEENKMIRRDLFLGLGIFEHS
jgi:NDP-sugar pyrophosphorylase family protein